MKIAYRKEFRALALRENDWRNCGLCVGLHAVNEATLL